VLAEWPDLDLCAEPKPAAQPPDGGAFARRWLAETRSPPLGTRLIVQGRHGLAMVDPKTGRTSSLGVAIRGAAATAHGISTADGAALLLYESRALTYARPTEFASATAVRSFAHDIEGDVAAVSDDATSLLWRMSELAPDTGTVRVMYTLAALVPADARFDGWKARVSHSHPGDDVVIAPEGDEAMIGCDVASCDAPIVRLSLEPEAAGPILPAEARHARYVHDRVLFDLPRDDGTGACTTDRARCPRDIVSVPRADLSAAPEPWRAGASHPAANRSAGRVAYLVSGDPGLPSIHVADLDGGNESPIAGAIAVDLASHALSPDGAWVVFSAFAPGGGLQLELCATDNSGCNHIAYGEVLGWLH
jgi:hypothetical protein